MRIHRVSKFAAVIVALASLPLLAACGDDEPTGGNGNALLGSWTVTSFMIEGIGDVIAGSDLQLIFTFTASTYTIVVANDDSGFFCDTGTTCTLPGDYTTTGNTITFDPGTSDEEDFTYFVTGDTLRMTGGIDGSTVDVTLRRT
jgi:hypothetical protein